MPANNFLDNYKHSIDATLMNAAGMRPGDLKSKKIVTYSKPFELKKKPAEVAERQPIEALPDKKPDSLEFVINKSVKAVKEDFVEIYKDEDIPFFGEPESPPNTSSVETNEPTISPVQEAQSIESTEVKADTSQEVYSRESDNMAWAHTNDTTVEYLESEEAQHASGVEGPELGDDFVQEVVEVEIPEPELGDVTAEELKDIAPERYALNEEREVNELHDTFAPGKKASEESHETDNEELLPLQSLSIQESDAENQLSVGEESPTVLDHTEKQNVESVEAHDISEEIYVSAPVDSMLLNNLEDPPTHELKNSTQENNAAHAPLPLFNDKLQASVDPVPLISKGIRLANNRMMNNKVHAAPIISKTIIQPGRVFKAEKPYTANKPVQEVAKVGSTSARKLNPTKNKVSATPVVRNKIVKKEANFFAEQTNKVKNAIVSITRAVKDIIEEEFNQKNKNKKLASKYIPQWSEEEIEKPKFAIKKNTTIYEDVKTASQQKLNEIIVKKKKLEKFKELCSWNSSSISILMEAYLLENFQEKKTVSITSNHLKKIGLSGEAEEEYVPPEDIDSEIEYSQKEIDDAKEYSYFNPIAARISENRSQMERKEREDKIANYRKTLDIYSDDEASIYQKAIAEFLKDNKEFLDEVNKDDYLNQLDELQED